MPNTERINIMIVSINQSAYLPWLGYFHRINISDIFVFFDSTQFEKNSMVNRNKIKTSQGWSWLSVPVKLKGHFDDLRIKYPVRREFSNYAVTLTQENLNFKPFLEAFRFKVKY